MNNLSEEDWAVLEQWLEDETFIHWAKDTKTEHASSWENYFNLNPKHWALGKAGRSLVLGPGFQNIPRQGDHAENALTSLLDRLAREKNKDEHQQYSSGIIRWKYVGIAASMVCLVMMSVAIYWQFLYNPRLLLTTEFGQQFETTLPDGSMVTLNANSKVKYYKQDPRTVWLDGEAYFVIAKKTDTGADFQVITNDLLVTVLGTSFNVNTRNDQTEIFLEEGKVLLDIPDSAKGIIEMDPGDLIVYSLEGKDLQEHRKDASALQTASWKEGALIFKEKPLLEALFEIEDIYGIQFIIQTDDLLKETITGGVPIRNLQVTLSTLTEVYGIQMKATGKRYFITGRE